LVRLNEEPANAATPVTWRSGLGHQLETAEAREHRGGTGRERADVSSGDLPEVRVRQPVFGTLTSEAGLVSFDSMTDAFGVDLDEVRAAVFGAPVSPGFVASVLALFPQCSFRELFHLDLSPTSREVRARGEGR
jgi:hypothetical protein